MKQIFITGISTEVGKTVVSAIVTEALEADYWKPIQSGDLHYSDTDKVKEMVSNAKTVFHKNAYALNTPMSPHAAAEIDNISIDIDKIQVPKTENNLLIEGAGGLLVPLNDTDTVLDIIPKDAKVILVSRHYLGSINHILLSAELLKARGYEVAILFNGAAHPITESIIKKMSQLPVLGRIDNLENLEPTTISKAAKEIQQAVLDWMD